MTRKKSDRNVRNYNKVVVADNDDSKEYLNTYRGKVQNRKVEIRLAPMFAVSYYEKPHEIGEALQYYKPLADTNTRQLLPYTTLLTNNERALSENEVQRHFDNIDKHSKLIADAPEVFSHRLARALDYYLVSDFSASLDDLNAALALDSEDLWLAYFIRATVRCKILESEAMNKEFDNDAPALHTGKEEANLDYNLVCNDLTQAITIMPDFSYALYNRGNIYARIGNYKSAIADYSEAIKLSPDFAEAYFNRGLAYIYTGKNNDGIADLSKAGELGLYTAYNIIKRFKEKQ
ncbi:MAG: tetratricopeptide repeat protein [Bacteroidaceae bacterium]|nr:tetratricopeptide repeat protein [Bacteroidaceae bacterium]